MAGMNTDSLRHQTMASGARPSLKTELTLTGVVCSLNSQFANYTNIKFLDDSN